MAKDRIESIDYPVWVQQALLRVVHRALTLVVDHGLPGAHHFYITFATTAPGVLIARPLLERYPEEMTVVLQNDFRDLEVDDEGFAVTLRFGGVPYRISLPYAAIRGFVDPSAQFGLRFDTEAPTAGAIVTPEKENAPPTPPAPGAGGGNVVSFPNRFRRPPDPA